MDAEARTQRVERRVELEGELGALQRALQNLPERQRQSWLMREYLGLTYAQIAELLEVSVSTVRGALSRARATLLSEMEAWR